MHSSRLAALSSAKAYLSDLARAVIAGDVVRDWEITDVRLGTDPL